MESCTARIPGRRTGSSTARPPSESGPARRGGSAAQILDRLREQGYDGGYTIPKQYLRQVRPPTREGFLTLHFEPAECAQVDWGHAGVVNVGNTRRRLSFFVMVLCYSRMLYVEFTLAQTLEQFLGCHPHAFETFGGSVRRVMVDHLKSAVLSHPAGQPPVYNPRYLDFAHRYGFEIRACNVGAAHENPGAVQPAGRTEQFQPNSHHSGRNGSPFSRHWRGIVPAPRGSARDVLGIGDANRCVQRTLVPAEASFPGREEEKSENRFDDALFNPSLALNFALTDKVTGILGTWIWKPAPSLWPASLRKPLTTTPESPFRSTWLPRRTSTMAATVDSPTYRPASASIFHSH